jgi:hypothetical protein
MWIEVLWATSVPVDSVGSGVRGVNEVVAMAIPATRDPRPLVTLVRNRTVASVDLIPVVARAGTLRSIADR